MVIVLDTSVLISAIRFYGHPLEIVEMGIDREVDIAMSQSIIDETLRVLRKKFNATQAELDEATRVLHACGRTVEVKQHFHAVAADPKDHHIVDTAMAANADVIVASDHHLLEMGQYRGVKMMRVAEFLGRLRER